MLARMSCGEVALVLLEIVGLAVVAGAEEVMLVVEEEVEGVWEDVWRFDGILCAGGRVVGKDLNAAKEIARRYDMSGAIKRRRKSRKSKYVC